MRISEKPPSQGLYRHMPFSPASCGETRRSIKTGEGSGGGGGGGSQGRIQPNPAWASLNFHIMWPNLSKDTDMICPQCFKRESGGKVKQPPIQ